MAEEEVEKEHTVFCAGELSVFSTRVPLAPANHPQHRATCHQWLQHPPEGLLKCSFLASLPVSESGGLGWG